MSNVNAFYENIQFRCGLQMEIANLTETYLREENLRMCHCESYQDVNSISDFNFYYSYKKIKMKLKI